MAYSASALARRRCSHVYPNEHARAGERCRAFARWDSPGGLDGSGLCTAHAGRTRGSEDRTARGLPFYECRTVPKCGCAAYPFPHRPGGGLCRWPEKPLRSMQPRTQYGDRLRWPARAARGYFPPTVKNTPELPTPATFPPPTVSGELNPAAPASAWIDQLARLLG